MVDILDVAPLPPAVSKILRPWPEAHPATCGQWPCLSFRTITIRPLISQIPLQGKPFVPIPGPWGELSLPARSHGMSHGEEPPRRACRTAPPISNAPVSTARAASAREQTCAPRPISQKTRRGIAGRAGCLKTASSFLWDPLCEIRPVAVGSFEVSLTPIERQE